MPKAGDHRAQADRQPVRPAQSVSGAAHAPSYLAQLQRAADGSAVVNNLREISAQADQGLPSYQRAVAAPASASPPQTGGQPPAKPGIGSQSAPPIQRAEKEAVDLANQHHPAGAYQTWADITAARDAVAVLDDNWEPIAAAYVSPGATFATTAALDAEAARMHGDLRSWTDPQARREAASVLNQMVEKRKKLREDLKSVPNPAQQQLVIDAIIANIDTLENRIAQIKTKYLMAHRQEGGGSKTTHKWIGNKKRTTLDLPQGGKLELFNKVNPATNRTQNLGEGGLGYGRFGVMDGETRFVKKQKLTKNETSAAEGVQKPDGSGTPLYEQAGPMQAMQLDWIEEEMVKFRREVDITTNRLNHPNVIKSYGGSVNVGADGMPKGYTVLEMMTGGDLTSVIAAGTATDTTLKGIMLGALNGLAHVHASGLIHRDIKPDNIMLDGTGVAKLIDFGEAVDMDGNGEYPTTTKAGTAGYYHPTKIEGPAGRGEEMIYDASTDLYALQRTFEQLNPTSGALTAFIGTMTGVGNAATLAGTLAGIDVG